MGCLPFCVVPSDMVESSNKVMLRNIVHKKSNYEAYAKQVNGLGKKELDFLTSVKGYILKVYKETQLQFKQYDPLLQAMLRYSHPMHLEYRKAYKLLFNNWIEVNGCLNTHYGNNKVGPMAIVWFFHFFLQGWLNKQHATIDNAVDISLLTKWVEKFLVQKKVDDFIPPFDRTPDLVTYVETFNNDGDITPGSGGSSGGAPGGGGGCCTGARGTLGVNALGTRVRNANIDPRFQASAMHNKVLCGRIKPLKPGLSSSNRQFAVQWARLDYIASLGTSKVTAIQGVTKRSITFSSLAKTRMECFGARRPCSHRGLASNNLYQLLWCLLQ